LTARVLVSTTRQLAVAWSDDELGRTLFRANVDDVGLRQLALSTAGGHIVDVTAIGRSTTVAADNTRQLGRLAIAWVASAATPARHDIGRRWSIDAAEKDTYTVGHKKRATFIFSFTIRICTVDFKNPNWKDHTRSTRLDKRRIFLVEVASQCHLMAPMIARRAEDQSISHQPSVAKPLLAIGVQPALSPSASNCA